MNYRATNKKLDLDKFMGTWYVQTGRVTFLEKELITRLNIINMMNQKTSLR